MWEQKIGKNWNFWFYFKILHKNFNIPRERFGMMPIWHPSSNSYFFNLDLVKFFCWNKQFFVNMHRVHCQNCRVSKTWANQGCNLIWCIDTSVTRSVIRRVMEVRGNSHLCQSTFCCYPPTWGWWNRVHVRAELRGTLVRAIAIAIYTLVGPPVRRPILDPLAVYTSTTIYKYLLDFVKCI